MTEGDQTVPTMSANRTSPDDDLNAQGATLVPVPATHPRSTGPSSTRP